MHKITCLAGLLLLAGSALAQQPAVPARYLVLVSEFDPNTPGSDQRGSLTIIAPEGTIKTEEIVVRTNSLDKKTVNTSITRFTPDSTSNITRRYRYARNLLYQNELKKLNELSSQGWLLVNTIQEGPITRYLLRQDAAATR